MTNHIKETLAHTKALADRQRLRILMLLGPGELCVCQVVAVLALAPSTVSKHLSILQAAGLIESRKQGRWAYYRLAREDENRAARPVLEWLAKALAGDETGARDRGTLKRVLACAPESLCRRQRKDKKTTRGA
jgi:ArsR family transcriptional regulator